MLRTAGCEYMQIHPWRVMPKHSMLVPRPLANGQDVSNLSQRGDVGVFIFRVIQYHINIDNWLCRQTWHCCGAHMFNRTHSPSKNRLNLPLERLEKRSPAGIIGLHLNILHFGLPHHPRIFIWVPRLESGDLASIF